MILARKTQLEAVDVLGKRLAVLDKALTDMAVCPNMFDAEAKLYFIASLSKRIAEIATNYHEQMHRINSVPGEWHDDECLHGINPGAAL